MTSSPSHVLVTTLLRAACVIACVSQIPAALAQPAPAASAVEASAASPALVDHLMRVLEKREQQSGGLFGTTPSALATMNTFDSERQLRALGARASAAAPRVAEMLFKTERNGYELAWTLWSISAQPSADELPSLRESLEAASGAARLELLAKVGRTRSASALPMLGDATQAADIAQRLIAGIALGYQVHPASGDAPARVLGGMLKDSSKPVRQVAANSLRLLGPRSQAAVPALIDYLRTRDNVYMATSALAAAPVHDIMAAQPELEAILADSKLSDYQKQPTVQLLLRIEQQRSADAQNASTAPAAGTVPAPASTAPAAPAVPAGKSI
jgi:hypothetical protein